MGDALSINNGVTWESGSRLPQSMSEVLPSLHAFHIDHTRIHHRRIVDPTAACQG